jgi:SAM-dependent methyltransferase
MHPADLYLRVREKEGRLYPDDIASRLPEIPPYHPLRDEWLARASSLEQLLIYLRRLPRPARVLELGCGNGWLSHQISALPELQVWGLDRHSPELTQAARLFASRHLAFLAADIFRPPFNTATFDLIVVASAIQYFPDLPTLIQSLRALQTSRGELHLLDSPLYRAEEVPSARERTRAHYTALGYPEMADHYFHHTADELEQFSPRWLYRPDSVQARLSRLVGRRNSPFPWLLIR